MHVCCGLGARGRRHLPSCERRPRSAGAASCGSRRPRWSSRPATRRRRWCWSASSRGTPRTGRGCRSSDRPARCCSGRWPRPEIAVADVYVTNAVKHFRFTERGKRRIHATPQMSHIKACRPWLEAEVTVVDPQLIVCLGATAAKALLGIGVPGHPAARPACWSTRPPVGRAPGARHRAPLLGAAGARRPTGTRRSRVWSRICGSRAGRGDSLTPGRERIRRVRVVCISSDGRPAVRRTRSVRRGR